MVFPNPCILRCFFNAPAVAVGMAWKEGSAFLLVDAWAMGLREAHKQPLSEDANQLFMEMEKRKRPLEWRARPLKMPPCGVESSRASGTSWPTPKLVSKEGYFTISPNRNHLMSPYVRIAVAFTATKNITTVISTTPGSTFTMKRALV